MSSESTRTRGYKDLSGRECVVMIMNRRFLVYLALSVDGSLFRR